MPAAGARLRGAGLARLRARRRHQRHRVDARLGLALEAARDQQLADVVVDRRGVERLADLLLRRRGGVVAEREPGELAHRGALALRGGADRGRVARALEQRLVGRAQLLARGEQVVGAVLADREVDRARRDARALQRLDGVGVLAALLAAQPLRQRVARGGELVERQSVELVGLLEHGPSVTCRRWNPASRSPSSTSRPASASSACARSSGSSRSASTCCCSSPASAAASTATSARRRPTWCSRASSRSRSRASEEHTLGRGDAARVAPDVRRQLSNRGDERGSRSSPSAARRPHEGRDGAAFLSWDDDEPKSPADVPLPDDLK